MQQGFHHMGVGLRNAGFVGKVRSILDLILYLPLGVPAWCQSPKKVLNHSSPSRSV
jgi:hypothetical protein